MKLSKTLIIFSLLMIFLLNVNMVYALEIDNIKSYDPITRTVTLKNSFLGIPTSSIAKATLNTPLDYHVGLGYQKVAEFKIEGFTDYKEIIKELEFYDLNNREAKINRDFDLRYKTTKQIRVDDYKDLCSYDGKSVNGTCSSVVVGYHYETVEDWEKLTPADIKKNEILVIGLFTEVQARDKIEWIPTIAGVKIPEWATWTADLNTDIVSYYKADENTGSYLTDELGLWDLSKYGSPGWTTGKINYGATSSSGNAWRNTDVNSMKLDLPFSANVWFKPSSTGSEGLIISKSTSSAGHNRLAIRLRGDSYIDARTDRTSGSCSVISTGTVTAGNWYMASYVANSSGCYLWINGVSQGMTANTNSIYFSNDHNFVVGAQEFSGTPSEFFPGTIDELGIWERSLTQDEITQLYNSGSGISYTDNFDNPPNVTLNSPEEDIEYTTSPIEITFNCSAYDDINLTEVKLLIDDAVDQTNASGINNTDYVFIKYLTDGNYTWTCEAFDNESQSTKPTARNIKIDAILPNFTINSPNSSLIIADSLPYNVTLNVTTLDANLNSCWYFTSDNSTNITYTCNSANNISFASGGDKIIYIWANDTLGNENNTNASFLLNYVTESASYPNPAIEGETYPINLTINATELNSLSGTLYYNGTAYNTTSSIAGSIGTLNTNLTIDAVNASTTKSFYWNYTLNGVNYSSSTYNHTIYFITPINVSASCSAGLASAMCFDFKDELNLTALSGDINYNFKFGISDTSYKETYGSLTGVSNFCLCVNATVYNNYTLGEGEIQYSKTGYADRRFYTFSTQRLTNETINNTLYLLPSASATSFLFDFKDTNLAPYASRYTTLLRWYPNLNEYKVVEMAKTDDKGETIMRVQVEDTDYRVGLYETSGSLITLLNPVRFACLSAPCSYSSLVDQAEKDYTSFFGVEGDIEFNETTNIWTLTWNDPSQNTKSMNLLVTRERGDSSYTICNSSASGFTGILTCDSTGYTGTLEAVAYRTASPATPIFHKIINTLSSPFASSVGLFFSFILVALLMLIGVYSPVASVILGILALLPALYMGVITLAVFIGIAVLGGIIIHFMKRTG